MNTHAWSTDPGRDAAVRAEEDGRQGALPTLEEAIGEVFPRQEATVSGLRTERITLEVTHDLDARLSDWIVDVVDESLGMMESVRVVEDCCIDHINMGEVLRRRDAAIREREELRARVAELEAASGVNGQGTLDGSTQAASGGEQAVAFTKQQRDAIHLAVSVLASVWNDGKQLYGEAIEALQSINFDALTASGGNHSANPNGSEQEPVAWGFFAEDGGMVHVSTFKPEPGTATVVPLYRLPSPPRGWLTGKERTTLAGVVGLLRDLAKVCGRAAASRCELTAVAVEALLARSTPPKVVLPEADCSWCSDYATVWRECLEAVRSSLAVAGVAVKEVP